MKWILSAIIAAFLTAGFWLAASSAHAAPTVCQIFSGCTGTSTAPGNGKVLEGDANGNYEFVSGSSLGPISSVFGRTGAVTAQTGDYTTSQVTEGSNLYYTLLRFASGLAGTTTDALAEGLNNLYYTNGRVDSRFVADLAATTSVKSITTLPSLSLPYSQLTGTPAIASSTLLSDANTFSGVDRFTNVSSDFSGTWQTFSPSHFQTALGFTAVPNTRNVNTTYPLQGGGALSSDLTLSSALGTTSSNTWGGTQTFTNTPVLGSLTGFVKAAAGALSTALINLTSDVTGTLPVGNGGTASTSLGALLAGGGSSVYSVATTAPSAGAGISLSGSGALAGGGLTVTNTGVTSVAAGSGISLSGSTGAVTITATGGSGNVATSTTEQDGQLAYWTTTGATPAKLGTVATGTVTGNNGISATAGQSIIGSGLTVGLASINANSVLGNSTGASGVPSAIATSSLFQNASANATGLLTSGDWTTFNNKVSTSRSLTVAGTANQITSSAAAQDLSADRTWTLALANHVIFPAGGYESPIGSTTNATSTNFTATAVASTSKFFANGLTTCNGATNALTFDGSGNFGCNNITTGTAASSTLLSDSNKFTGKNLFLASTTVGDGTTNGGLTVSGTATTSNFIDTSLTSALALFDANHKETAYGGASACSSNNFVTTISATGATTCGTASITVNGTSFNLGDSKTITAASSTILSDSNKFTGKNMLLGSTTVGDGTVAGGLTVSGTATTSNLIDTSLTSALALFDANHKETAYGGASACSSNNFVTTISATGATTCATASVTVNGVAISLGSSGTIASTTLLGTDSNTFSNLLRLNTGFLAIGSSTINGSATTTGSLSVFGSTTLSSALNVSGGATLAGATSTSLAVLGSTTISGQLNATAAAVLASSTLAGNTLLANATSTNFALTAVTSCSGTQALTTNSSGSIVCGTITASGAAYPFAGAGNSTSTLTQFNNGITAYASSTIGDGTGKGGLTINGPATTTGELDAATDQFKVNTNGNISKLGNSAVNLSGTSLQLGNNGGDVLLQNNVSVANSGIKLQAASGKTGDPGSAIKFFSGTNELARLTGNGLFGIGTTSPTAYIDFDTFPGANGATTTLLRIASSTASATTTLFQIDNTGNASTTALTISGLGGSSTQCLHINSSGSVSGTGSDCGAGGGSAFPFTPTSSFGTNNANATSTTLLLTLGLNASSTIHFGNQGLANQFVFDPTVGLGLGTTTPRFPLQIASSSAQLALTDSASSTAPHITLSNRSGSFYIATSSLTTFATSSVYDMYIDKNGRVDFSNRVSVNGYNLSDQLPNWVVSAQDGDFTSIQAALDACGTAGGGTIYLADVSYTITSTLLWKGGFCQLWGNDVNGTQINVDGSSVSPAIKTNLPSGLYEGGGIHHIQFQQTNSTRQGTAIDMSDMAHMTYENVTIDDFGTGYRLNDTQNITFYNHVTGGAIFSDGATTGGSFGINASSTKPANDNTFENIKIGLTGAANKQATCINLNNAQANVFSGVTCEPNGNTNTFGVQIAANSLANNSGTFSNTFHGVYIEGNQVGVTASSTVGGAVVFGNNFFGGQIETNTTNTACQSADCFEYSFYGTGVNFVNTNTTGVSTLKSKNNGTILTIDDEGFSNMAFNAFNNTNFGHNSLDFAKLSLLNGSDTSNLLNLSNAGSGATIIATSSRGTDLILSGSNGFLGVGTSTPKWLTDFFSGSVAQLALSYSSTAAHWVFNNIGGNLFIATSSPSTFATSTNADPNTGFIEFPSNGGCIGCTDIHLPNGIDLRNGKYVLATSSAFTAWTTQDIYTAPTGRRAIITGYNVFNANGTAPNFRFFVKLGGSYYFFTSTTTPSSLANAGASQGFILDPGESVSVWSDTTSSKTPAWVSLIEFDSTVPLKSVRATNPSTATSTLYTVPTGVTALVLPINPLLQQGAANSTPSVNATNNNGAASSLSLFIVKNGQSALDTVNKVASENAITQNAVTQNTLFANGASVGGLPLNSGDSIQYWLKSSISTGSAGGLLWVNVFEH